MYIFSIKDTPVAFVSVIHFPHPSSKNIKRIHRIVVLPDYQGVGIGAKILDFIGSTYTSQGFRLIITSSLPHLAKMLTRNSKWNLLRNVSRNKPISNSSGVKMLSNSTAINRLTFTFEFNNKIV